MRLVGRISDSDVKWARDIGTAWYRSKESVPTHPHFVGDGYLSNKKWPLIEESTFFLYYSFASSERHSFW